MYERPSNNGQGNDPIDRLFLQNVPQAYDSFPEFEDDVDDRAGRYAGLGAGFGWDQVSDMRVNDLGGSRRPEQGRGKGQGKPNQGNFQAYDPSASTNRAPVPPPPYNNMPDARSQMQEAPPAEWAHVTTVMMRNIPNKYSQRLLLTEVNESGFLGTFDFLYLPIDGATNANRGYGFLNFIAPSFAWMFKKTFDGRKLNSFNSNKVVAVMPAALQGFDANYAHYSTARVNRGDPAARPLFLREPSYPMQAQAMQAGGGMQKGGKQRQPPRGGGRKGKGGSDGGGGGYSQSPAANGGQIPQAPWPSDGGQFPDPGPADRVATPGSGNAMPKFCHNCGSAIQMHFQFCPCCGANINYTDMS